MAEATPTRNRSIRTISSTRARGRRSGRSRPSSLALGGISYMHGASLWWVCRALLGVAYTMIGWWRDVIKENEGDHTPVVQLGLRYGMILFIASEVMFFVAWFWAFFDASLTCRQRKSRSPLRVHRWALAADRHRGLRSLAPAAAQHADPAHLRHDGHLGAPFAASTATARACSGA
jgi:hypothetical protein